MIPIFITIGEFADRFSILKVKERKIENPLKLQIVMNEISRMHSLFTNRYPTLDEFHSEEYNVGLAALLTVNTTLWDLEDTIRMCENDNNFDELFIQTARKIYKANDRRFELKKNLSIAFREESMEVKELPYYDR